MMHHGWRFLILFYILVLTTASSVVVGLHIAYINSTLISSSIWSNGLMVYGLERLACLTDVYNGGITALINGWAVHLTWIGFHVCFLDFLFSATIKRRFFLESSTMIPRSAFAFFLFHHFDFVWVLAWPNKRLFHMCSH
ncbi:hypothetical protein B0T17DRAFT_175258 [Bombardia bombarda]|uniref:Uncharacterized protein n=1 Tax=Bombardia bombarda TaxID=252184 RepID=A0AA39X840_9PEZI|nr:hypothetical protein B0T17DRAFT_175258 [Bombardia bombarda]